MALLEVKNICKSFTVRDKELIVLDNINESADEGELIALVGPSGAGKSTLMHIMGGLDKPTSGSVIFNGLDICSMSEDNLNKYRGQYMGFIFQFHYLLDDFTALENVMMPMLLNGASKNEASKRALELIKNVGLEDRINHYPSEMSGGEQQRIALSRALINKPKLILADEPTGNLDKANSMLVLDILKKQSENGVCVIIVTHDENIASSCDRKIVLDKR